MHLTGRIADGLFALPDAILEEQKIPCGTVFPEYEHPTVNGEVLESLGLYSAAGGP
jgi:hypothetical protein